jgi:hypothetical protein
MRRVALNPHPLSFLPVPCAVVDSVLVDVEVDVGGFRFRKEVQILQGLPSGPRTVPGGRGPAVGVEPGDFPVGTLVPLLLAPVELFIANVWQTRRTWKSKRCGGGLAKQSAPGRFSAVRCVPLRPVDILGTRKDPK